MAARSVLAALLLAALGPVALAQSDPPPLPPPPAGDTGTTVYQKVLRSTVWVHSERTRGTATGTGSLIDKGRRLVLTNYHVVGEVKRATVYFPTFENGKAVSEKSYYTSRSGRLGIPGDVVELDKGADLALIRVDRLPEGANEIALGASPDPGQTVHSIGNPGSSGALWVYTPGKVRQVYDKKWQAELDPRTVLTFQAKIVETDSPTNPGDSGGPLANDKGELIGVTQGGAVKAASLSTFIDISEVKRLMNRRSVQALRSVAAVEPQKKDEPKAPAREKALVTKDGAKFFGEAAVKKTDAAAEKLFKEKKTDMFFETIAAPPKGDPEKVKAMTAGDREKFFRELAQERGKAEKVNGVYILVCRNPTYLTVERLGNTDLPDELGSKLKSILITAFKDKKFDDGLNKAVEAVLESKGMSEKKNPASDDKEGEGPLKSLGWNTKECMVCQEKRTDNDRKNYSDTKGFGFCQKCGKKAESLAAVTADTKNGVAPSPAKSKEAKELLEGVQKLLPKNSLETEAGKAKWLMVMTCFGNWGDKNRWEEGWKDAMIVGLRKSDFER